VGQEDARAADRQGTFDLGDSSRRSRRAARQAVQALGDQPRTQQRKTAATRTSRQHAITVQLRLDPCSRRLQPEGVGSSISCSSAHRIAGAPALQKDEAGHRRAKTGCPNRGSTRDARCTRTLAASLSRIAWLMSSADDGFR